MLAMLTGLGAMAAIDLLARAGTIALLTLMGSCSYATVCARLFRLKTPFSSGLGQCFGGERRPRRAAIVTRSGSESAFIFRIT
jgi:hypothetical protein